MSSQAKLEVLRRVLWPLLLKWTQEKGEDVDKSLVDVSAKLVTEFTFVTSHAKTYTNGFLPNG